MFNKRTFLLLAVFLFGAINFADEIVLQNGLNDYNGCSDTHIKIIGDGDYLPFYLQNENYHTNIIIETAHDTTG